MGLRLAALKEYLHSSLWFIPALFVLAAIGLGAATLAYDRSGREILSVLQFAGSAESARTMLSAIATAVISLTALVFSVTVVVLQLASSQYSPRVLRTFLRDRRSQTVLGVFLATFAYTMLVLRSVRDNRENGPEFVPALSVHAAFALTALTLAFFVLYVHHISQSMQVSSIVAGVAEETSESLRRLYPSIGQEPDDSDDDPNPAPPSDTPTVMAAPSSGYLQAVNEEALLGAAVDRDVVIRLIPRVGDFVPRGSSLFEVHGGSVATLRNTLPRCVTIGRQRTMQQDPEFGFRQLVDIAEKALSPSLNDPTTAVEAINRLHELLLIVGHRQLPSPRRNDERGNLRLILPTPSWSSYVNLAFDEIRQYGGGSVQVLRRLGAVAEDLMVNVPKSRAAEVAKQAELIRRSAERNFKEQSDVDRALSRSRHG